MAKLSLAVFFGGRSGEHEVSLMSARSVLGALDQDKYQVYQVGITHDGDWLTGEDVIGAFERGDTNSLDAVTLLPEPSDRGMYVRGEGDSLSKLAELDVAVPILHGPYGEDGTIQGLFEMADLAYVGAGVLASAVAMDKGLFKWLMRAHHIPVLDFTVISKGTFENDMDAALNAAEAVADYPLFTKPANMGSSVGVRKVHSRSDLVEGLMDAAQYDRRILVERGIEAREIEVSVLGNEKPDASVPGEVIPSDEYYSYRAKYIDDRSELHIPAPIDYERAEEARGMAIEAYKVIDGEGMARVDLLMEKDTDQLYLNEVNTIPGFTSISMYPKLWEASGLPYPELMDRLIELAQARKVQKDGLVRTYEGAA
ncbi:MAG: D-alanine--D-alanine ligase family protein [Anaerolineales bacterium]